MSRLLTRARFGLPADPWKRLDLETGDALRAAEAVRLAAEAGALVSISGPRGAGKTRAVRRALSRASAQVVEPLRLDRDGLTIGDVQHAIVRTLSDESPAHSAEARAYQVRRILGEASGRGAVVLFVDEAHHLHHQTVRALKRLREFAWLGRSPLCGVLLVGQGDRTATIPEVGLRADLLEFAGLGADEAAEAVSRALGPLAAPEVAALIAADRRARNWLDLQELVDRLLAAAAARGLDRLTAELAGDVLGAAPAAPDDDDIDAALDGFRSAA